MRVMSPQGLRPGRRRRFCSHPSPRIYFAMHPLLSPRRSPLPDVFEAECRSFFVDRPRLALFPTSSGGGRDSYRPSSRAHVLLAKTITATPLESEAFSVRPPTPHETQLAGQPAAILQDWDPNRTPGAGKDDAATWFASDAGYTGSQCRRTHDPVAPPPSSTTASATGVAPSRVATTIARPTAHKAERASRPESPMHKTGGKKARKPRDDSTHKFGCPRCPSKFSRPVRWRRRAHSQTASHPY